MQKDELILKVENVSKIYKLGEIGGTTLRDELQRLKAKVFHKEDPTKKIGAKNYNKGEKFKALDNISFDVKKGERIGIIGHNGAGKSTLLKLISRVTGPTDGKIYINGRVASMLEVGTGFHPELTGRENVYMNGAILGMTKKEIDSKMEDIIEFSEVRQFIDTPVKRYSSGMYVKLAFSVAAHLDSEIMIMDEVLAVGDMAFQNKCLKKMKEISEKEDRTILYVSHNMNTIRQLCDKTIVLDHGKIVFAGDVDEGIAFYSGVASPALSYNYDLHMHKDWRNNNFYIKSFALLNTETAFFLQNDILTGDLVVNSLKIQGDIKLRYEIYNSNNTIVGVSFSNEICLLEGDNIIHTSFELKGLAPGRYYIHFVLFEFNEQGYENALDGVFPGMIIEIVKNPKCIKWDTKYWGNMEINKICAKTK